MAATEAISVSSLVAFVFLVATAPSASVGSSRTAAVAGAALSVATTAAPSDARASAGETDMSSMPSLSNQPVFEATASSATVAPTPRPPPRSHPLS